MKRKNRWTSRKTRKTPHGSNGQDKEGCWSELPYEILDMIVQRIFFIDLINLRAVCKPWRYYSYDKFQPLKQLPWLLVFGDFPTKNCSCKLIDPAYKKTYNVNDPKIKEKKLYDMEVHESKCGWMLMSSQSYQPPGTSFLLYSPFLTENNIIELPVLSSKFIFATFSTGPSTSQNNCVCLAFNNSASGEVVYISTYRCGDHTWTTQSFECFFPLSNVTSVVYSGGVFYCPSYIGSIGTFNIDRQEWVVLEPVNKSIVNQDAKYYNIHLIKSDVDGEFLLVLTWKSSEGWKCPSLSAYRLDRSGMIWERLRGLGNLSLFMATKGTSVAMKLPEWEEWEGNAFLCWDRKVMYFKVPSSRQVHERCYPCTKLYGSVRGQLQKPCWIEPSL